MKNYGICIVLALMCAGCVSRQMPRLKPVPRSVPAVTRHDGVEVRAQVLDQKAVTHVLGGYSFSPRGPHYTALHVTVENNTANAVVFKAKSLPGFVDGDSLVPCWFDRETVKRAFSDESSPNGTELVVAGGILGVAITSVTAWMIRVWWLLLRLRGCGSCCFSGWLYCAGDTCGECFYFRSRG